MTILGLGLLCLGVFTSAAVVTFEDNVRFGNGLQHSLGSSEYQLRLAAPDACSVTEDDVAALYKSLGMSERSLIAQQIQDLLEGFRGVIINGSDQIPVLDPFVIDQIGPFVYNTLGVRASGTINNLRVEGLQWYIVDHVTFNALRLAMGVQVTLPWIITTGSYDAHARVAIVSHSAGGNFRVFVNRLVMSVDVRLGTNILGGGHLILRELDIKLDIHDTQIHISGIFGSSLINSFINSFVQSITQDVIQSQLETVSTTISEQLFDVINEVLRDFTLDDLLG